MKRLILLIALLLPGLAALAGEPYFCLQKGRTLYYERYDASGTKLRRTTTLDIMSVEPSGSGRRVEYGFTLRKASGAVMYGGRSVLVNEIDADGTVRADLGASLKAVIQTFLAGADPVSNGDTALLPADMKPGDTLPEAHCSVETAALKYRIDVTERQVLRAERITVPAGTFDCMVVREHKVERGPGHHRDTVSDSWYAPGVGYVRHDTYDSKYMRLDTTEVLKKY